MKYIKYLLAVLVLLLLLPQQTQAAESCGTELSWTLTDGILVISGSGDMTDYSTYSKVPWYSQRKSIRAVQLPEGMTSISRYAFYGCTALTEITVPDSVLDIGSNAFSGCTGLTEVKLGAGLSYIGDEAFSGCTKLTDITIPDGVSVLGYYAFTDCTALQKVTIGSGLAEMGDLPFCNCTALISIEVSAANRSYSSDSAGCLFDKNKTVLLLAPSKLSGWYDIPDGVEEIAPEAFFECIGLTALSVPVSLNTVGSGAFYLSEDLSHISYAGTALQWSYISVFEDNDYYLQADTVHYEASVYHYENCVSSGMFCDLCDTFITEDRVDAGSHVYSSYEDLSCDSCGFERSPVSASVTKVPDVTTYTIGQTVIYTHGGIVQISYSDGSAENASMQADMVSGLDTAKLGTQILTVQCMGQTASFTVTVVLGTPDQLELKTLPAKLEYLVGSQLNLSGLTLTAQYDTLGTVTVTAEQATTDPVDMTVSGRKTVTVRVGEKSVQFTVFVHEILEVTPDAQLYPESAHNYGSNMDETQTFTWPGAENLILTLNGTSYVEDRYDYLYILDGEGTVLYTLTGKLYNEVLTVPGDTVSVRLKTDSSGTRYGYAFSSIVAQMPGHSYLDGYCTVCGRLQYKVAVCENGVTVSGADTVEQAVGLCADGQYLKLYADARTELTLERDLYIDLAGFDLTGTVQTYGCQVYGMDSTTDSYSALNAGHMELSGCVPQIHFKSDLTGSVKRYMAVQDGTGYSFHRFYLGITHLTLRPDTDGVGYKAVFYGDDAVIGMLERMGYTMTLGDFESRSVSTEQIVSGKTVSLRIDHYDVQQFGQTELTAAVFLKLKDGTVITATPCTMTLRGLFEQLDFVSLTESQQTRILAMIERYPVIRNWVNM